jgi:pantoate--beta-alanine ligase
VTIKNSIKIVRKIKDLRAVVKQWREQGDTIGLIPTMGALHHGHLSLVSEIKNHCSRTIATIFVNKKQFGPNEDFDSYPRTEEDDIQKLESVGCDLLYAPSMDEIYPKGFLTQVSVSGITEGLCAADRPTFFDGITTVVTKLLIQALPDKAIFGEKDYQQLAIIKRLVKDLDIPTQIIGAKLIRDEDGLASSSRNRYLSTDERVIAINLHKILKKIVKDCENGHNDITELLNSAKQQLLDLGFSDVKYLEIRDAETLELMTKIDRPARIITASIVGKTRLLDNMAINPPSQKW